MDAGRRSSGLSKSCVLIIVVASVERFAYKGVASNLVTYLTDVVKLSNSSAAKSVNSWCGVTSMLPLVGAFLADSYWDRYSTILASSLLYILGLVALTSSAFLWVWITTSENTTSSSSFFCSLYLISLGQGGYNPCLQAFGADQLENENGLDDCNKDDDRSKKKRSYFQWWYFGICTGSLLGVTLMSYIQDTFGWVLGFAIPTIAMASSVACFTCATRYYIPKQSKVAEEKPAEKIFQLIKATLRKILTSSRLGLSPKDGNAHVDADADAIELELQNRPLREDFDHSNFFDNNPNDEIPVDGARAVLRLMPVWATLLMFAVIFQQPSTFFTKQGNTMQRKIGNKFVIPPATLQSAITISIILLMPLYDKLIIPITRIVTRDNRGINVQQRMGIGMFLSIIAMIVAALVESKRIEISRRIGRITQPQQPQLNILWLLPQYILLGISDVFTVVGMQEYFYTQVPNTMRTMGIALYLSVFGVGSFLSAFLITLVETITGKCGQKHSWFSDDMREARLDNYYWLLALSSTLSFLLFVKLSKRYNCRNASANGSS